MEMLELVGSVESLNQFGFVSLAMLVIIYQWYMMYRNNKEYNERIDSLMKINSESIKQFAVTNAHLESIANSNKNTEDRIYNFLMK